MGQMTRGKHEKAQAVTQAFKSWLRLKARLLGKVLSEISHLGAAPTGAAETGTWPQRHAKGRDRSVRTSARRRAGDAQAGAPSR